MRLVPGVVLALLLVSPAEARQPRGKAAVDASTAEEGIPPRDPEAAVPTNEVAVEELPAADRPAEELPDAGLWQWVRRLEGEPPSEEALAAARERGEEEAAELPLVEELGGADVVVEFYDDPKAALSVDPLFLDRVDPSEFDIPIVVNDAVRKWVRYFTGPGRKYYARWMGRSTTYRPMMYAELEKRGLPRDLVYLSMIESGYNAHAYSHAHAAGLWQFIPSTGKIYDLRIDWWVDERRDPEKSTHAALTFLADLHKMFDGSWELAWAAYNGGPGRMRRATRDSGSTDFWTIAAGPWLHSETDNYVPKIMAAAIIGKHPERYGFTDIAFQPELAYDSVPVEGSVEIEVLARCAGLSEEDFRYLNPALRRWATPPDGTVVRVPKGNSEAFAVALAEVPVQKRLSVTRHKVARGETLSAIASRYGVPVGDVVRANQLRDADRIYVGMTLVIPTGGAGVQVADRAASRATDAPAPSKKARPSRHTVAAGETLSGIAARHGVSVADLRAWNGLKGDTIRPGQELALSAGAAGASVVRYTVRKGDSLSGIAARYGVSAADVQKWNGIRNPSHIVAGQSLEIQLAGSGWKEVTVSPGDSLGVIASRHGCSVDELRSWNTLKSDVIHPGQRLRVRN